MSSLLCLLLPWNCCDCRSLHLFQNNSLGVRGSLKRLLPLVSKMTLLIVLIRPKLRSTVVFELPSSSQSTSLPVIHTSSFSSKHGGRRLARHAAQSAFRSDRVIKQNSPHIGRAKGSKRSRGSPTASLQVSEQPGGMKLTFNPRIIECERLALRMTKCSGKPERQVVSKRSLLHL